MRRPAIDHEGGRMSPTTEPRATLHAIWQTRPSRRQSDRKIAGVAAAIARRYDIDPVLVRIAFVVAAFYGVGVLVYLAAWVALPADPADPPTGLLVRQGGAVHPLVVIAAVIAGIAGMASLLRGDPGVLVGLAVFGGLLYLLHQSRSERGLSATGRGGLEGRSVEPTRGPSPGTGTSASAVAPGSSPSTGPSVAIPTASTAAAGTGQPGGPRPDGTGAAPAEAGRTPPAWDPLGAAPFAWDLPEPAPPGEHEPPPGRRSTLTLATLGLALLAGGITGALTLAGQGLGGVRMIFGVMLAVVGLGLLVGAFRHAGRGLIALAIPLMLLGAAAAQAPVRQWHGAGELHAAPTTLAELAPSYRRSVGEVTLDLRRLDFTGRAPIDVPAAPVAAVPGTAASPPPPPAPVAPTAAAPVPAAPASPTPAAPPLEGQARTVPAAPAPTAPAASPAPATAPTAPTEPGAVRTSVTLDAGDVQVLLPPNVPVRVHCHADLGDVRCLDQRDSTDGPSADIVVTDPGVDVPPGSRPLELDVSIRTGDVEVRRG
jgi:phage shock protein PspC (stress-responsive transcriptional regulator)